MGHYNSTRETGQLLMTFEKDAIKKDGLVLSIFSSNPTKSFTPVEIFNKLIEMGNSVLLTSVRRSCSDLKSEGKIINTGEKKIEIYGRPTYLLMFNSKETL